jgi:hypothetical protein
MTKESIFSLIIHKFAQQALSFGIILLFEFWYSVLQCMDGIDFIWDLWEGFVQLNGFSIIFDKSLSLLAQKWSQQQDQ